MKFFLEIGSCCGGATVTPAAESAITPLKKTLATSQSSRRSTKANSSTHWKPALSALSEDRVVSDLVYGKIERSVRHLKKAKSTAVARSPGHSDKYRKDSMWVALPSFAPTPFLF
ncbi:Protein lsd90 like [Actinidia chinensis var. chinensis]|uniref:Protein lsd90 like n=1 Tax=Actinidia chinensis var. chinensis TaxID=1590841 RepID=A0A2R6PQD4_ACTCC|nr:Protein lsd90 like [Actinidia chinensis var. chinensis]